MRFLVAFTLTCISAQAQQSEFVWKHTKTTLFQGKLYDTFQNQEGDQVVKTRTPRSPDQEEEPTAKNLPTRQSIFEFGLGIGYHQSSLKSLDLTNPEDPKDMAMYYDGTPIQKFPKSFAFDINVAIHPPVKILRRTTIGFLGTAAGAGIERDKTAENVWNYSQNTFVAKGARTATADLGLNAYVSQDVWYIPAKESVAIFSAGFYYGYKTNSYQAGVNPVWDTFKPDQGVIIKYRQVFDNGYKKSFTNLYVQAVISKDKTYRVTAGWILMGGRANAPKTEVAK